MIPVSWLHWLGQRSRAGVARSLSDAWDDPERAQRARLRDILRRNQGTEYGRKHGFASVAGDPAAYARQVPIVRPDEHAPWVDRMMRGERNVLTAEAPVYYVQTTGTTGVPKHVPITPSYRAEFQRSLHASMWHLCRRLPEAFTGRVLYSVGSARDAVAPDGCPIGTMSGYNFTALPRLVRAMYAWPPELFAVRDLRTRSWLALQLAIQAGPSLCGAIFPLGLVLLFRELERRKDELAHHLERGTLPPDLALEPLERGLFERLVRPAPAHAAALRAARSRDELLPAAFPALRLAVCWTGATASLYVPELKRWLGSQAVVRDGVYSAAEGWMNVPMGDDEPGGPVCVTGHYLEFIDEDRFVAGDTSQTKGVHQLEVNRRYAVVLTTSGGTYRYSLGDIVEVYERLSRTPCIRFVRKAGAHCSLVGEKLDESHVNLAVGQALAQLRFDATWFCLAPRTGGDVPGYTLHIEAAPGGDVAGWCADLGKRVDWQLRAFARDYASHRGDTSLGEVQVRLVTPGTFEGWRAQQAAQGAAIAQQKAKHLVARPEDIPAPLRA